mmetsp:Transcript_52295/g.114616  ORF Transcript_52295/g.114616 Transcript_52295/m.114616 type:complete len:267 (+) Transcript_52295:475-1275(+)
MDAKAHFLAQQAIRVQDLQICRQILLFEVDVRLPSNAHETPTVLITKGLDAARGHVPLAKCGRDIGSLCSPIWSYVQGEADRRASFEGIPLKFEVDVAGGPVVRRYEAEALHRVEGLDNATTGFVLGANLPHHPLAAHHGRTHTRRHHPYLRLELDFPPLHLAIFRGSGAKSDRLTNHGAIRKMRRDELELKVDVLSFYRRARYETEVLCCVVGLHGPYKHILFGCCDQLDPPCLVLAVRRRFQLEHNVAAGELDEVIIKVTSAKL